MPDECLKLGHRSTWMQYKSTGKAEMADESSLMSSAMMRTLGLVMVARRILQSCR